MLRTSIIDKLYVELSFGGRTYSLHECNVKFNINHSQSYHDKWWDIHDGAWVAETFPQDPVWIFICWMSDGNPDPYIFGLLEPKDEVSNPEAIFWENICFFLIFI